MDLQVEKTLIVRNLYGCREGGPDLKAYINSLLDAGEFVDGYELAVRCGQLTQDETQELMTILMKRQPAFTVSVSVSLPLIERLRQTGCTESILVHGQSIIFSNGFHVYRIEGGAMIWDSGPIAMDGIDRLSLAGSSLVTGRAFTPYPGSGQWVPFAIDIVQGRTVAAPSGRRSAFRSMIRWLFGR